MKTIGITGPTGAGKTTALQTLAAMGVHIIDADAVYHDLLVRSIPLQEALIARFGRGILAGGQIDRKALGQVVFGDPAALADLNLITRRFISGAIREQTQAAAQAGRRGVAIDAIGLIESGLACDATVAILAPKEVRICRIMAREGISEDYARRRVEAQQPDSFYRTHCGYVLENNGTEPIEEFQQRAAALFAQLLT